MLAASGRAGGEAVRGLGLGVGVTALGRGAQELVRPLE